MNESVNLKNVELNLGDGFYVMFTGNVEYSVTKWAGKEFIEDLDFAYPTDFENKVFKKSESGEILSLSEEEKKMVCDRKRDYMTEGFADHLELCL